WHDRHASFRMLSDPGSDSALEAEPLLEFAAHLHELEHPALGELADMHIPAAHGLEEVKHLAEPLMRQFLAPACFGGLGHAFLQPGDGRVDLALLAFIKDALEHLPDILHVLVMVPAVAQVMSHT